MKNRIERSSNTVRKQRAPLPELLAPAGSRKAFLGAMKAGADAVYLGGEKFGARAYAENFTREDIIRSVREAHILGKKVYLTLNVLTKESELEETVRFAQDLYEQGLDGAIVQDIGVLARLHERCPGLALHASTQMSVTGPEAVRKSRSRSRALSTARCATPTRGAASCRVSWAAEAATAEDAPEPAGFPTGSWTAAGRICRF